MTQGALEAILEESLASGVTPGGVILAGDGGQTVLTLPFGRMSAAGPERVRAETLYDVASLTKPVATVAVLMHLVRTGALDLDATARSFLRLPREVSIGHLVGHAAGLPPHARFYDRILAGELEPGESPRDALVRMAEATPLVAAPGARAVYSDVGFILLGALLERAGDARLDELVRSHVTGPLAMDDTCFVDLATERRLPAGRVAPTEICPRRGPLRGEVHDDNAHAAGGICGHAGLFSAAADLSRFAAAICAAARGRRGPLAPEVVTRFVTTPSAPGTTWRLGWDTPSPSGSHAGDLWPRDGFGHLAFTGCSLWLDPPRGRWVVLLTNRVHPTRDNPGIAGLRRRAMDAVVRLLEAGQAHAGRLP